MDKGQENEFGRIDKRIYKASHFYMRLTLSRNFESKVAGCSTFSLEQVTRDISSNHISIRTYAPNNIVRCDLDDVVYQNVFGSAHGYDNTYLWRNALTFGRFWAAMSLAEKKYNVSPARLYDKGEFRYNLTQLARSAKELKNRNEVAHFARTTLQESYFGKDVVRAFGSIDRVIDFLDDSRDRGGVQIIYGANNKLDFADFLKSVGTKPQDDRGAEVPVNIPGRFVMAIIPLGKYEEKNINSYL